jgi:hypothetical protein
LISSLSKKGNGDIREMKMQKEDLKGAYVGRRGFLKAMTMAGMAATFPETILATSKSIVKPENRGNV